MNCVCKILFLCLKCMTIYYTYAFCEHERVYILVVCLLSVPVFSCFKPCCWRNLRLGILTIKWKIFMKVSFSKTQNAKACESKMIMHFILLNNFVNNSVHVKYAKISIYEYFIFYSKWTMHTQTNPCTSAVGHAMGSLLLKIYKNTYNISAPDKKGY